MELPSVDLAALRETAMADGARAARKVEKEKGREGCIAARLDTQAEG